MQDYRGLVSLQVNYFMRYYRRIRKLFIKIQKHDILTIILIVIKQFIPTLYNINFLNKCLIFHNEIERKIENQSTLAPRYYIFYE